MLYEAVLTEKAVRYEKFGRHADRAAVDLLKAGLTPLDAPVAAFRITVNGEHTTENYISVGGAALGGAIGSIGKVGSRLLGNAAETATAHAARLGAEGEQAVGLLGPKVGIRVPGAGNIRFPDNLTTTTLTEVKNVASQGLTKQLRDYITISQKTGRTFDLYVRGPLTPSGQTRLTEPLIKAVEGGTINLKFIPGTF